MQKKLEGSTMRGSGRGVMRGSMKRAGASIMALCLMAALSLMIAGCGGGGGEGVSSQVVSGVAATGAPLAGEAKIKDSSSPAREKTTVIGGDGTFAFDVTDMKGPFILRAAGNVDGTAVRMLSFAEGPGTANINPFTNAIVAMAAQGDDPDEVFNRPNRNLLEKIKAGVPGAIEKLLKKLRPLLRRYNADTDDPITIRFRADHTRLDGLFDAVKITLLQGVLTITNKQTGAVIYTGNVTDILNGNLDEDNMPNPGDMPDHPGDVKAVGGDGQVTISWKAVGNAISYNIYWSLSTPVTKATGTKIAGAVSPYVQTGLAADTRYYYIVTAVNSAGESEASDRVSATTTSAPAPAPTIPAAPVGVSATGGTKQVTVSWPAVSGATSYNLYWSATAGVTKATGTKISGVTSPTVQNGLTDSTTYYYILTAVNSAGESDASVQVAATTLTSTPSPTAPAAPTGVSATGDANQATVSWSTVTGATSYNLYWSTTSGVTTATGTKIAGTTSPYVHMGLSAGTAYYYIVTAVNGAGESPASTEAAATTSAPSPSAPAAPTGVTATGGVKQVSVSWSAVSGAASYNLYWGTASGVTTTTGTKVSGATSPYVHSGLADSTAYFYIVTALNGVGESAASAQATATTNAPQPAQTWALYTNYCAGCHGTSRRTASASAVRTGITGNAGGGFATGMGMLASASCTACHPGTGRVTVTDALIADILAGN